MELRLQVRTSCAGHDHPFSMANKEGQTPAAGADTRNKEFFWMMLVVYCVFADTEYELDRT